MKLTKDTTKNNFLNVLNLFRDQVSVTLNKKVDLSDSLTQIAELAIRQDSSLKKVAEEEHEEKKEGSFMKDYDQSDIQKCQIG